ncbi:MAG: 1-(5-phosphoribosyl)-5-amino-4-imidazole-carboxylate carboxylase [Deltaproteobacteria bacterium SM23_61]|nr:MAG: 1-(5-phosphoribosyl)-5-amino-4-imidazole-carboxylate carboxylase [Deltaproteobacteria bacterium SM23_61]
MNVAHLKKLLEGVQRGQVPVGKALQELKHLPYEEIDCATIDHHRHLRQGAPETIFGAGKTAAQVISIMRRMQEKKNNILVTRLDREKVPPVKRAFHRSRYYPQSRVLTLVNHPVEITGKGTILVLCAGTSDIPVAEEAILTARMLGNRVDHLYDVGVAGIHRLMSRREQLMAASVLVVIAGMEGALPSVVAGLVDRPVIAVPTSVGYGSHFGGITALLAMLNSCASGVTVVNIDNGYGAAFAASQINKP